MLRSMTGFGRFATRQIAVEIQSLNRKGLDIAISLPKEWSRFEFEVRQWVGEALSRGQITLRISLAAKIWSPDVIQLKEAKQAWHEAAVAIGADPTEVTLSFLMLHMPPQQSSGDAEMLREAVQGAIQELIAMKKQEGAALGKELLGRLDALEGLLEAVIRSAPDATEKMKMRLREKLLEIQGEVEDRLLREVALFAEKVDISEEISRFKSHVEQFRSLLTTPLSGRKMDFLIQEMFREVNTMASKSMEAKISHLVVDMKGEIEKMREQVQNLE